MDGQAVFVSCSFIDLYDRQQAWLYRFDSHFISNIDGLNRSGLIGTIMAIDCFSM